MSINGCKYPYPIILNEKVGCSIHLSGTKSEKKSPATQKVAGFCFSHHESAVAGSIPDRRKCWGTSSR